MWLPSSLLPLAIPALPAFQFLDGADSLCRTERVSRRGGDGGFRPPALRGPDPSCGCHAGNLGGVISLASHSAECHVMSRGGSIISSGFQVCNRDWACFLQLCACPNRVNSRRCTFFARSDDEDVANKQRQFPRRLCCYVALFVPLCAPVKQ